MTNEESQGGGSFRREMVKGEWQCSDCGAAITELPFEPTEGRPVFCRDCYRSKRPSRAFRR